jgi:DNA-binding FadR family transcriptional regulator
MTSAAGPVRVPSTADLVASRLRGRIVRGELADGAVLQPFAELCAQFGVSAPTLREALRILESESLLTVRRGLRGGAIVHRPRPELATRYAGIVLQSEGASIEDVLAARAVIEPAAVRALAERPDPAVLARLRDMLGRMDPAADSSEVVRASTRFHLALVEATGNLTLRLVAGVLGRLSEAAVRSFRDDRRPDRIDTARAAFRAYGRVPDLVEAGRGDEAEALMRSLMGHVVAHTTKQVGADALRAPIDVLGA